ALAQLLEPVDVHRYGGDVDYAEEIEEGLGGCARRWKRGDRDQQDAGNGWSGEAARRDDHISSPPRTISPVTLYRQVLFIPPASAGSTRTAGRASDPPATPGAPE